MRGKQQFEERFDFYPFGTQYHRAPTPLPAEWEPDLKEIARAGFTHVQYRPQWRWHERVRGQPTWDDLDRLFDLAHQCGLRVVLKPMLETAPDWVFGKGQVFSLGASLSLSFADRWDDPVRRVFDWLLRRATTAQPKPPADGIWVRRRIGPDREIWFVFNVSDRPATLDLPRVPRAVWFQEGCARKSRRLHLEPGATGVVELAVRLTREAPAKLPNPHGRGGTRPSRNRGNTPVVAAGGTASTPSARSLAGGSRSADVRGSK